jgi:drug/metabolite transporter (DMT)-like permease
MLQPMLTLAWSSVLLGELIGLDAVVTALAVVGCVALTQSARRRAVRPT